MNDIVDYALPLIKIEKFAKQIHDLCLDKRYEEAIAYIDQLESHSAILRKNLIAIRDQENK